MPHHPDDPQARAFRAMMNELLGTAPAASSISTIRHWLNQLEQQLADAALTIADIRAELARLNNSQHN